MNQCCVVSAYSYHEDLYDGQWIKINVVVTGGYTRYVWIVRVLTIAQGVLSSLLIININFVYNLMLQ